MSKTNATSSAHARMLQRQSEALQYRRGGSSYAAIGDKLGITAQRAHQLVKAALVTTAQEIAADTASLRALEVERLDVALRAIADRVKAGDLLAIDRWLRISERRSKLTGLDAPTNVNVTIRQEAERLAAETGLAVEDILAEFNALVGARR